VFHGRAAGVGISITSSFAQPPRQDFTLRFSHGEERRIPRISEPEALLHSFADMCHTNHADPADIRRWLRNAAVIEKVQARIGEMEY
jgi:hypothetical protein